MPYSSAKRYFIDARLDHRGKIQVFYFNFSDQSLGQRCSSGSARGGVFTQRRFQGRRYCRNLALKGPVKIVLIRFTLKPHDGGNSEENTTQRPEQSLDPAQTFQPLTLSADRQALAERNVPDQTSGSGTFQSAAYRRNFRTTNAPPAEAMPAKASAASGLAVAGKF